MKSIFLVISILSLIIYVGTAYGHGTGIESSPYAFHNDREIKATVEMLPFDFYQSDQMMIKISIYDHTNRQAVTNTNLNIEIVNDDKILLNDWFFAQDGTLILEVNPGVIATERNKIEVAGQKNEFGLWEKTENSPITLTGPIFNGGGIFTFKINVDAQNDIGIVDDLEFEIQVSVTEVTYHTQTTQAEPTEFRVKSYYDNITGFEYDTKQKTATIILPFDFTETNISHTSVVHTEIMFPKNFIEFLAPHYFGTANGIDLFKASVFVDDYSEEENRIVHFILLKDHLRHLKTQLNKIDSELPEYLELTLKRGEELQFPLKTLTLSEEFRVDLSWDPKEIKPNVPVKFIYTFRNPVDQGPIRDSDYTFTLLQNGQEIFSRSTNAKIGADYSEYTFSEEQTGLTIARFSNISGSGQETEFAFVIGDKKPTSIPAWIKNNAGWWADGQIPDSTFVDGIQFLIKEGIIVIK